MLGSSWRVAAPGSQVAVWRAVHILSVPFSPVFGIGLWDGASPWGARGPVAMQGTEAAWFAMVPLLGFSAVIPAESE